MGYGSTSGRQMVRIDEPAPQVPVTLLRLLSSFAAVHNVVVDRAFHCG